jgi:hypothetical protein
VKLLTAVGIVLLLSGLSAVVWIYLSNPSDFDSNLFDPVVLLLVVGPVITGVISFRLARVTFGLFQVRVIALAFLIVALSVPATFYYADQTAQTGCVCGTGSNLVTISGSILVRPSSGFGNLTITVWDTANDPISRIWVNSSGLPEAINIVFYYNGGLIDSSNSLPTGDRSTGLLQVRNVTAGSVYDFAVVMMFQNQNQQVQALWMTAQI